MEVKFDYSDAISTANADVERTVDTPKVIPYGVGHTRDFYRGRSFRYAGKWKEHVHYLNDEYITDFVEKDGILLVCRQSNMSSSSNEPTEWVYEGDRIVAVISDYWEVVLVGGLRGKTYLPEYDEDSDSLVWKLVESDELPEEFQTYLGIKDYIDYSLVPVQEDIIDLQSDADITKRSVIALEGEVVDLGNGLTTLEVITGHVSTHVEDLEGNFNNFVQTSEGFFYRVGDLENNVGQLWLTSQQFGVQMENAEGDIARLTIESDQISTRVENAEGDISQINQRADEISTQVENQQGDISRISQQADQIQSEVENQQGDISVLTQKANLIQTQVQNLDGEISIVSQRADQIQLQVENVEGDVSTISQRADAIESRVSNDEGDISQIRQTSNEISVKVANVEGDIAQVEIKTDEISSEVSNQQGDISTLIQRADNIESTVTANKAEIDGELISMDSRITQTAGEIQAEVTANKIDADSQFTTVNSRITQQAGEIESKVSQTEYDLKTGELDSGISAVDQKADNINLSVQRLSSTVDQNAREFASAVADLQNQIDGAIDTWFYNYAPVHTDAQGVPDSQVPLSVAPYSDWLAAETVEEPEKVRDSHVSDIFYDQHSGYAYRFIGTGNPGSRVYTWVVIQDSAVIKALEDAARAQDTADNKRRVFVTTPYAPYDLGDLWVKTTTVGSVAATELYRCVVAKTTVGTENIAVDWSVADSYAKEVSKSNIEILSDAIIQQTLTYTYDEYGRLSNATKSAITTGMNDISLAITGSKLETVGIFIRNANVNDNYINLIADKVRIKGTGDHTPTGLSIIWDSTESKYKIDVDSLNVSGIFSTSDWSSQVISLNNTAQGYANTAENNAKGYADTQSSSAQSGAETYFNNLMWGQSGTQSDPASGSILYNLNSGISNADAWRTDLKYITDSVLNGTTVIAGGLVLSSLIMLGDNTGTGGAWQPWAGICGEYDNSSGSEAWGHGIAAWYGGTVVDKARLSDAQIAQGWATHRWARSLFRMDGSGYLADNNIWWGASGELHIGANTIIGNSGSVTFSQLASTVAELASYFEVVEVPSGASYVPYLKLKGSGTGFKGLVVDGFISAGGLSSGGGQSAGNANLSNVISLTTGQKGTISANGVGELVIYDKDAIDAMLASAGTIQSVSLGAGSSNGTLHLTINGVVASDVGVTGLADSAYRTVASSIGASITGLVSGSLLQSILGNETWDSTNTVKAFVNSSIATATATFRGTNTTATTESAFLTWANALTHDLNDYVFWRTTDSAGNTIYKRYMFDGTNWIFEYELNNSSFTAAQWSAINSGVTATKVTSYDTIAGYFDANGKIGASNLPALYIGTTAVRSTSQQQDLAGIGVITMGNNTGVKIKDSGGSAKTVMNLSAGGRFSIGYGISELTSGGSTEIYGKSITLNTGSDRTTALSINATQVVTFANNTRYANARYISFQDNPSEGTASYLNVLEFSSNNNLRLGYGIRSTDYNTSIYGGQDIYFVTNISGTPAARCLITGDSLRPNAASSYDLGTSTYKWRNAYIDTIYENGTALSSKYLALAGGTMSNTNLVTNLNADLLDGLHETRFFRKSLISTSADCNTMEDNSFTILDQNAGSLTCGNKPANANIAGGYGVLTVKHGVFHNQLFFPYTGDCDVYTRSSYYSSGSVTWMDWYKLYHSGNSNKSDVAWNCSTLATAGDITINSPDRTDSYGLHINEGGSSIYGFDIMYGSGDMFSLMTRNGSSTPTTVFEVSRGSTDVGFKGNVSMAGVLSINPAAISGVQDGIILHDSNGGGGEGLRIKWTAASYTTGVSLSPNGDHSGLECSGSLRAATFLQSEDGVYVGPGHSAPLNSPGWYRVWQSDAGGEGTVILNICHNYYYSYSDAMIIAISYDYGYATITQIAGSAYAGAEISKIRFSGSGTTRYIDIYYNTSNYNGVNVSSIGRGYSQAPTLVTDSVSNETVWDVLDNSFGTTGNIFAYGAVTAGSASDRRLKDNVKNLQLDFARTLLMSIHPVSFTWNSKATSLFAQYQGNDVGLIAQEVELYMPSAIKPIFRDYKRLEYHKLIPPVIRVVQDHETRIKNLEEELKKKDQRINDLENEIKQLRLN